MGRAPLLLLLPWLFVLTLRRGGERAGPRQGRSGRGQGLGGTWKRRGQGRGLRSERGSRVIGPGEGSRGWGLGGWWRRSRIGGGRAGGAGQGRCRCWGRLSPGRKARVWAQVGAPHCRAGLPPSSTPSGAGGGAQGAQGAQQPRAPGPAEGASPVERAGGPEGALSRGEEVELGGLVWRVSSLQVFGRADVVTVLARSSR